MWKITSKGLEIAIKVFPNSGKNEIIGWENDELKIRVAAPPEKGSANEELIAFLSKKLKISKSNIKLLSGATCRHKRLCLIDIKPEEIIFF